VRGAAEAVLRGNDAGEYTLPSRRTYPHQWGWDSALCALGWAVLDEDRALRELVSLAGARLPWGALPQIAFRRGAETAGYEPGPEWWGDVRARDGRRATAITQPPVAATCLRLIVERSPSAAADPRVPGLVRGLHAAHRALLHARGAVPVLVHPWESGRVTRCSPPAASATGTRFVKVDLEARGEVERVPGSSPQRVRRAARPRR